MSRPTLRRALARAGLAPEDRKRGPRRSRGVAPPPLVFLPGEPVSVPPPPVTPASLFGRSAPLELEIGPGRARFLLAEAEAHPDRDFLGLELEREYAAISQARADRRGLTNVRILAVDGKAFVALRVPPGSLAALHAYFPDPWPKKRHHKRRLFDGGFAAAAAAALAPGAPLRAASDHEEYWSVVEGVLDAEPLLERIPAEEIAGWTTGTDYELKYARQGKSIGRGGWRRRRPTGSGPA